MISQNKLKFSNFSNEYLKYSKYLDTLNIKKETKEWWLKHIKGFDSYLYNNKLLYSVLKPKHVYNYMNTISNLALRTKENRVICIRMFLKELKKIKQLQ